MNYCSLHDLINQNKKYLNKIKEKYLTLLSMLTDAPNIDDDQFNKIMTNINNTSLIWICYINQIDSDNFNIIGTGTLFIEHKFIHGGKNVAHIEDIVVHQNFRNLKISQTILDKLKEFASNNNCYKIILDCNQNLTQFYIKNNFDVKGIQMAIYL